MKPLALAPCKHSGFLSDDVQAERVSVLKLLEYVLAEHDCGLTKNDKECPYFNVKAAVLQLREATKK